MPEKGIKVDCQTEQFYNNKQIREEYKGESMKGDYYDKEFQACNHLYKKSNYEITIFEKDSGSTCALDQILKTQYNHLDFSTVVYMYLKMNLVHQDIITLGPQTIKLPPTDATKTNNLMKNTHDKDMMLLYLQHNDLSILLGNQFNQASDSSEKMLSRDIKKIIEQETEDSSICNVMEFRNLFQGLTKSNSVNKIEHGVDEGNMDVNIFHKNSKLMCRNKF